MSFQRLNGITLHYRVEGAGTPLVFLNSLGTDLRLWDSITPVFASRFRVIRYDKRGHGLSDCPPVPYTIRDHTEDLEGLLDALRISSAILVGISVGGMIALDFARLYPRRVKALVLCSTAPKIGKPEGWNARITAVQAGGMASIADAVLTRWFTPTFVETHLAVYRGFRNMLMRTDADGYIGTCAALRDTDLTESVRAVQTDTLVMCGAQDPTTTPERGLGLASLLPKARYVEFANAAHLPCVEQPERFTDTVMQFLAKWH
jgi:3-oxoadipate enol-lactonase